MIAKRRGAAVTVSHQIPPVDASDLVREDRATAELYRAIQRFGSQQDGALKETLRERIRTMALEQGFDRDLQEDWTSRPPSNDEIENLGRHIHLIDEDRIPVGLHVHGQPSGPSELAPMIAAMLGEEFLQDAGCKSTQSGSLCSADARERAAGIVRAALVAGEPSAVLRPYAAEFDQFSRAFQRTPDEIDHTLDALAGGYVPPGGGGDPLRNPQALPTGRNLYGINPAEVPTQSAWELGVRLAQQQLEAERVRLGRWPRKIGFTLWNTELIRQQGTDLAHILFLLGVRPVWDHRNVVEDVELIPLDELRRPRIDVVVQAASLFRDTFPDRMKLLDQAVRLAGAASDGENYIAEHSALAERELKQVGMSPRDARALAGARIFSNSAGGYGTGLVASIERSGDYASSDGLTEAYLARTGAVYTRDYEWGKPAPAAYREHLRHTDAVTLSRSTNVVGALTLDHYFEYLGGMTMAVRDTTGTSPETYLADVRNASNPRIETAREALIRGLRGKFWNPKWIRELQREGFSGAVEMAQTATNLYGWQVTKPEAVGSTIWERVHAIYVDDSLELGLPEWFDSRNPFAYQEVLAVLVETARKGYWQADAETLADLALHYVRSLERHGASGSIRTTGNRPFEEFTELHVAMSTHSELVPVLQDALRDGAATRVEGRRLVEHPPQRTADGLRVGPEAGLATLGILAGAFWIGWRRKR